MISRGVSSSGRIAKSRALECRQAVAEFHPADVIAEPGMMRGRKRPGRIEAAGGDVDEVGRVQMLVGERRTAGAAEAPLHLRRRLVLERRAAREAELRLGERDPRDHRRCGRRGGRTGNGKPCCSPDWRSRNTARRRTCSRPGCPGSRASPRWRRKLTVSRAPKKRAPPERGSSRAETGVLFRRFWSVDTSRVPVSTNTLCHEGAFSPTPKTLLLRSCEPVLGRRFEVAGSQSVPDRLDLRSARLRPRP